MTDDFRDGLIAALDHALRLRRTRVHSDERFLVATRLHCMVSRGHLAEIWQRRPEGIEAWADPNHKLADP